MLHTEEMRSRSTGMENLPNARWPTPESYVLLSNRNEHTPDSCVELDEPICLVVTPGYISRHLTPSGRLLVGWYFVGIEAAVRSSPGETYRLLSK